MSCKLVFVGSTCSGKTQILITYTLKQFPTDYIPTVFENYDTFIKFQDRTVKLGLWDTAGQEEYDRLRYLSYPNTNVVAICFSTVNRTSFFDVEDKWLPEIKEHCPEASIMLIGTHIRSRANREHEGDPVDPLEIISTEEGMELARKIKAERYLEVNCTAQEVRGVNEIFETAIELYFSKEKPRESASSSSSSVGDRSLRRKSLSLINYNNNNNNGTSPTTRKRLSAILFPSSWFKDLTTSEASIDSRGGNSPISLRSSLRDSNNNNNSFTSSSSSGGGGTGPDISLNSLNNQNNANSDTSSTTTNSARSRITEDEAEREIIQLRKQVALLTASLDEQKNLAQALELRVAELQEYIRTIQAREAKLAAQLASAVAVASSTTTNTSNANANNNCSNSNSNTQPKRRIERHAIDIGNSSSDKGNIAIASVESLIDKKLSAFAEILREHTVRHDNQIAAYQKMLEAALGARTMPSPQYQCSNEMLQQQQQQEQQQQREERAIEGSQQAQRANDEAPKQEQVDLTEELPPAAEKVSSELRNANERNGSHDIIASETELCNTATSM